MTTIPAGNVVYPNTAQGQPMIPPPPQGVQGQPAQVIIIQSAARPRRDYSCYNGEMSKKLGMARIAIGLLCITFGIVAIVLGQQVVNQDHYRYYQYRYGFYDIVGVSTSATGIWCGCFFILAGSMGLPAGSKKTLCWIVTNMILAIISASLFVIPVLVANSIGLASTVSVRNRPYERPYNWGYHGSTPTPTPTSKPPVDPARRVLDGFIATYTLLILFSIAEVICDIWSAAICCKAACCCNKETVQGNDGQQVLYQPGVTQVSPGGYQVVASGSTYQPGMPQTTAINPNPADSAPPPYEEKQALP